MFSFSDFDSGTQEPTPKWCDQDSKTGINSVDGRISALTATQFQSAGALDAKVAPVFAADHLETWQQLSAASRHQKASGQKFARAKGESWHHASPSANQEAGVNPA